MNCLSNEITGATQSGDILKILEKENPNVCIAFQYLIPLQP